MLGYLNYVIQTVGDDNSKLPQRKRISQRGREQPWKHTPSIALQHIEPVLQNLPASGRNGSPSPAAANWNQSDDEADSDRHLSVLSYNVYAGSPLNIPVLPRQQYSLLASGRLPGQVREILRLRPSVVCLQEVHSKKVVDQFVKGLSKEYDCYWVTAPWHRRLMTTTFWVSCTLLAPAFVVQQGYAICAALLWFFVLYWTRQSCLCNFLTGEVHAGLLTMWRREQLELAGKPSSVTYAQQSGEIEDVCMVFARPRAYLRVPLRRRRRTSRDADSDAIDEPAIDFLNTHALLGDDEECCHRRSRQVGQVLNDYSTERGREHGAVILAGDFNAKDCRDGLEVLLENGFVDSYNAAGDPTKSSATWSPENPLTEGYHCEEIVTRLDYVLSKGATNHAGRASDTRTDAGRGGGDSSSWTLTPVSSKVVLAEAPYLSDHFGVLAVYAHERPRGGLALADSLVDGKQHLDPANTRATSRRASLSPPVSPPSGLRSCSPAVHTGSLSHKNM